MKSPQEGEDGWSVSLFRGGSSTTQQRQRHLLLLERESRDRVHAEQERSSLVVSLGGKQA